ncbi:MAG: CHAT domain-containing protein, partial [Bacteroidota bacterium]
YYQQFQEEVFTVPTGASFGRFWGPIASELAGVRRVFYVPDGIFHRINPALLYAAAPDYFLLEKVAVTFAASLAAVTNPDLPGKDIIRALLVGNPDYGPPGTHRWAALPKTQNEVIAARKHLQNNGATATLLTAKAATPRQVQDQIPGQQLLHLATHAYFRPYAAVIGQLATAVPTATAGSYPSALNYLRDEQGRRTVADQTTYQNWLQKTDLTTYLSADSLTAYQQKLDAKAGIVLAGANASPRDGYLLRSDLARLDLAAAQMVILSACDVGRGDLNERTELGGFAQDFRAHGVRYLISSLWPVQDRAGGAFITAFYRAWLTDNLPPEQAFVAAQRELLEAGEPLYYWGGFTLTKL